MSRSGWRRLSLPATPVKSCGTGREAPGAAESGDSEPRVPLTRRGCARRPAAMEEGMSSMQQKAAELEHMAEVLLTGEQLR